jgi:hypothetical protein
MTLTMPDYDAWWSTVNQFAPLASDRANDAWQRISDKPSTVAVWRGGSYHHDEIVRVEWGNSTNVLPGNISPNTVTSVTEVVLFGVNGHATVTNTDIVEGDEINLSGQSYQVKDALITTGELQARCVRIT